MFPTPPKFPAFPVAAEQDTVPVLPESESPTPYEIRRQRTKDLPRVEVSDEGEPEYKVCNVCQIEKKISSFPRMGRTKRRATCNRCVRGRMAARNAGMETEEYLSYSNGPCMFCDMPDTSGYKFLNEDAPCLRICQYHRVLLRPFKYFEDLQILWELITKFPFVLKFAKDNNLKLFLLDMNRYNV